MADRGRRVTWGEPAPERVNSGTYRTLHRDDEDGSDEDQVEPDVPVEIADRYERREPLGEGGMGLVWRYWDRRLERPVALKVIRKRLVGAATLARFEEEARITAGLQHPGIIPVHDLGQLDDGRVWFTMKEVQGRTLEELLMDVHAAWRLGREAANGFTFRRMLEAFLRVCETVAYAHARDVVHRDLKPSNIMVGDFGELLVLDWGLAKAIADTTEECLVPANERAHATRMGEVAGTPSYMAPEQARGEAATAGPPADVYALGATLYDAIAERPPRIARNTRELVRLVAAASPIEPPSRMSDGPAIDEELDRICMKALAADPADRYPDAGAMAEDLAHWLDGARKRERAIALVEEAEARMREAEEAEARAVPLAREAEQALAALAKYADPTHKQGAWRQADEAEALRSAAHEHRTRAVQLLRSALSHAPDLTEAHDRLADHFLRHHRQLEATGDALAARAALADLQEHDRSRRHVAYVRGTGALTLVTDPAGAEVRLHRFVLENRRLVPRFERVLGTTPLRAVPIEMGSYLCTVHAAGHAEVPYPVWIRRGEHWDGVAPGSDGPLPIRLPADGELGAEDCYVPAGWFWAGDDHFDATLPLQRLWMDPLVVRRFVVTTGEYVAYLDDLAARGLEDQALAAQPCISEEGGPWLHRGPEGRWTGIRTDLPAEPWDRLRGDPTVPIVYVTLPQAQAFAAWSGPEWRVPTELEFQRAARGADIRAYPWGDHFEAAWARSRYTDPKVHIVSVRTHPEDVSVYGVRGMAGNVHEWAASQDGSAVIAGGACAAGPLACMIAYRVPQRPTMSLGRLGFRLFRSFS